MPVLAIPAAAWAAPPLAALGASVAARRDGAGPRPATPVESTDGPVAPGAGPRLSVAPLPTPVMALIGRERERAEVVAALAASRLVTLTGAGGTGKTRLALAAAAEVEDRFADGVAFIDLAPVGEPALLATAIAAALGLAPPTASAAEGHVSGALGGKHLLLVVDNLEQLVEGAPVLGRPPRPGCRSWRPAGSRCAYTGSTRCGYPR